MILHEMGNIRRKPVRKVIYPDFSGLLGIDNTIVKALFLPFSYSGRMIPCEFAPAKRALALGHAAFGDNIDFSHKVNSCLAVLPAFLKVYSLIRHLYS